MRRVSGWEDLRQFGICYLTGEADVLGQRLLCDLTAIGVKHIREFFGLPDLDYAVSQAIREGVDQKLMRGVRQFDSNMNNGDKANPHVASIMLFRSMRADLAICCLMSSGCQMAVEMKDGTVYGLTESDLKTLGGEIEIDDWEHPGQKIKTHDPLGQIAQNIVRRVGRITGQPAVGLNAVHAMSGRHAGCGV